MNACYSVWNTEYIRTRYANYSHSQVEWRKWSFKDKENFIYIYIHILDSFFETSSLLLFLFLFLFSLFSMWTRGKEIACVLKRKKTDLSLWNFRLCTTCGIFCRKFHRCKVSSAVAETNAPSLIKNCNCITAVHPSCLTCASTPGRPKLYIIFVSFVIN